MSRPLNVGQQRQAREMRENALEAAVAARCKTLRLLRYHTYRSQKSPEGFPDDVIIGPGGVLVAELKREGEHPTAKQQAWLDGFAAHGHEVVVWRPTDLLNGTIDETLLRIAGRSSGRR